MECEYYGENGEGVSCVGGRQQLELWAGRGLRLGPVRSAVRLAAPRARAAGHVRARDPTSAAAAPPTLDQHPFMNNMDEISYWIYTKRAPCLMNYDNVRKQNEEPQSSKPKLKSVPSVVEVPSPKKKKRKLSLLDDDSGSEDQQQNVYFDSSQQHKPTVIASGKSDTLGSDIDFNIKNTSVQGKAKRSKLQKTNRTTLHKKNKVVTSTPKACNLRRSLRQAQQHLNNNSQLNSSFDVYNNSIVNGNNLKHGCNEQKTPEKLKPVTETLAGGDQTTDNKKCTVVNKFHKDRNEVLNGQFEDLSDVSGFTANYIRSTKLQSTKTPRKLRCKNNKNLVKESQQCGEEEETMVLCVNKSVNTCTNKAVLNCSTESENVVNLVTKSSDKPEKINKSTSLLKFMDAKTSKSNNKIDGGRTRGRGNLNVSFQSQISTSRYPKRHRKNSTLEAVEGTQQVIDQTDKRRKISKNSSDFNNSDRKENPEATNVSRTRSGRNIGLTIRPPENSVLVLSNSTEQVSSMVSMNVATPPAEQRTKIKKKRRVTRRTRKSSERACVQRDSLRDKSGFAACFSDSDDSEPLKQRKFFCAN